MVERLWVFRHVGFLVFEDAVPSQPGGGTAMHTDYLSPIIA